METRDRDPGVPSKHESEAGLTRHLRLKGPPRETRLYGYHRIPRNLGGGIIGMFVLFCFIWGLAGYRLSFLLGAAGVVGLFFLAVWALIQTPLRPTFDQRWHPKRRIEPLDTKGWTALAKELRARFTAKRLPRIEGAVDGVAFRLEFRRKGGARTLATAVLPEPAAARLEVFPRRATFSTPEDRETGDAAFDRAWHVTCSDRATAARLLPAEARLRISAAEPDEVWAEGGWAAAMRKSFTEDPTRLRALVHAVVAMAGADDARPSAARYP